MGLSGGPKWRARLRNSGTEEERIKASAGHLLNNGSRSVSEAGKELLTQFCLEWESNCPIELLRAGAPRSKRNSCVT